MAAQSLRDACTLILVLWCNIAYSERWVTEFQRKLFLCSPKMEADGFSKMLLLIYDIRCHHVPVHHNHHCKVLKSLISDQCYYTVSWCAPLCYSRGERVSQYFSLTTLKILQRFQTHPSHLGWVHNVKADWIPILLDHYFLLHYLARNITGATKSPMDSSTCSWSNERVKMSTHFLPVLNLVMRVVVVAWSWYALCGTLPTLENKQMVKFKRPAFLHALSFCISPRI